MSIKVKCPNCNHEFTHERKKRENLSFEEKFIRGANIGDAHECWVWTGPKVKRNGKEYGVMRKKPGGKFCQRAAKTYSLLYHGIYMPPHTWISSICGNTLCVNPKHMRVNGVDIC